MDRVFGVLNVKVIELFQQFFLTSCYEEKFYFNPGDTGFKVLDAKFVKIGIGTSGGFQSRRKGNNPDRAWRKQDHNLQGIHLEQDQLEIYLQDEKEEAVLVAKFDLDKIKSKRHSWGDVPSYTRFY